MKKILMCVAFMMLPTPSSAAFEDFTVYYLNGIYNSPPQAIESREKLQSAVLPDMPLGTVRNLYQNNTGMLREVLERVRTQASADNQRDLYRDTWRVINDPSLSALTHPVVRDIFHQTLARYDEAAYAQNHYLQAMVKELQENYYSQKKKALLVSHSQGNLYANQLVNYLQSSDPGLAACVGAVGVASPATYMAKNGPYETRADDTVINRARTDYAWGASILPATWVPNYLETWVTDPSRHAFVTSYVEPQALRSRIRAHIDSQVGSVRGSCAMCTTPFNIGVISDVNEPSKLFYRYLGSGKKTVKVRVSKSGIDSWGTGVQIWSVNRFRSNDKLLLEMATERSGTYYGSFAYDSAQTVNDEVLVWVFQPRNSTTMNICIDCGNETTSSLTSCP